MSDTQDRALAEKVRAACVEAALAAYEEASIAGLCGEGALEVALGAIRELDLASVLDSPAATDALSNPAGGAARERPGSGADTIGCAIATGKR